MRKVKIYTTTYCGYCRRAKQHFQRLSIPYEEINVEGDDTAREWLVEATGQHTVPQIFFDDESIGGCTDFEALERSGKLNEKLGRA